MTITDQIASLKRRIAERKLQRRSYRDLEAKICDIVTRQLKREIRADRRVG